jgi:hypothetical protein
MPRISGIDPEKASPATRQRMDRDMEQHGHILSNTGISGHAPTIQEGMRALDAGITAAGRIPQQLRRLMNLRAAQIVGCPF